MIGDAAQQPRGACLLATFDPADVFPAHADGGAEFLLVQAEGVAGGANLRAVDNDEVSGHGSRLAEKGPDCHLDRHLFGVLLYPSWNTGVVDSERDTARNPAWVALGEEVIRRRVELGMRTRRELVEASGISRKTLGQIERGDRESYDRATLAQLEQTLRWPPGQATAIVQRETPDVRQVTGSTYAGVAGSGLTGRHMARDAPSVESLRGDPHQLSPHSSPPGFPLDDDYALPPLFPQELTRSVEIFAALPEELRVKMMERVAWVNEWAEDQLNKVRQQQGQERESELGRR